MPNRWRTLNDQPVPDQTNESAQATSGNTYFTGGDILAG
ncbi:MAG: hypothetical protein JW384_03055 [Nitrosomonadaceae bacterium]|nr:hypothetical protein [Nitrosomonadaceae bacterium]